MPIAFPTLSALLDGLAPPLLQPHHVPGCQVAVRINGSLAYSRAFGLAGSSSGTPLLTRHIFKACSNGKPFAALVALKLVDQGLLSLDQPIWPFIRSWQLPADRTGGFNPDHVTLRRILCHQSGFTLNGFPQVDWSDPDPPSTIDLLRGRFGPAFTPRLNAPPGGPATYAGDGYTLAQLAIEDVTGLPLTQAFDSLIARPLNLRCTWYGRPAADRLAELTDCHDASGPQPTRYYPALAASGLYTTAEELTLLYASLPQFLTPSSLAAMLTPHATANNGWTFGLGFALAECNGRRTLKHAGWSDGSWGAAEGLSFPPPSSPAAGNWPATAAAVLTNSSRGKDVVLPLLGAITQRLTQPA